MTYHYPLTTVVGYVYGFLVLLLPMAAVVRLAQRYRHGERFLGWQLALFATALVFGIEEALVANRILECLSLLDLGFLLLLIALSWQVIEHVVDDALQLRNLSDHLRQRTVELEAANAQLIAEVAERGRVTDALRESRAKLAAALASMTDAELISDTE